MTQLETQGNNDSWKKSIEESWKELHYISRVHFFLSWKLMFIKEQQTNDENSKGNLKKKWENWKESKEKKNVITWKQHDC